MNEDEKGLVRTLELLADNIRNLGFPKQPFFVQTDPRDDYQFFIVLWRNASEDRGQKSFRYPLNLTESQMRKARKAFAQARTEEG